MEPRKVIDALMDGDPIEGDWSQLVEQVKKAIRIKCWRATTTAKPRGQPSKSSQLASAHAGSFQNNH